MSDEEALGARGDAAVCRMLDALLPPETAEGEKVSPNCSPQLLCLCSGYRGACLVRGRVPSSAAPASSRGPGDRGDRAPWDPGLGSGVWGRVHAVDDGAAAAR